MAKGLILLCCVVLLGACSGSAGGDDGAATTAPQEALTTTAPANDDVVAISAEPCTLLTADDVATATGLAVSEVVPDGAATCVFDLGAEAGVDVFITVDDGTGRMTSPSAVYADYAARIGDGTAESVAGVGAAAVYDSGFRAIAVDAGGGQFFVVGVNGGFQQLEDPRDAMTSLAQTAVGRL